ncbi:MAG: hypothetical protein AB7T49_08770 [Oligoflexales bacterium]
MKIFFFLTFAICSFDVAFARSVYLNGQDISSVRSTTLKNVNILIDDKGSVYIEAPHYKVDEQNTYLPLSRSNTPEGKPQHQLPSHPDLKSGEFEKVPPAAGEKAEDPPAAPLTKQEDKEPQK